MVFSGIEEGESVVSVVSESEMLVMFVIWDGGDNSRDISEGTKYYKGRRLGKKIKGRNINNRIITYLRENFRGK